MDNYSFFMKADLSGYMGDWVAICDGRVVAHGKDVKKVYKDVTSKYPKQKPLIAKVPTEDTMIF